MAIVLSVIAIIWIVCGVISYGALLAFYQYAYWDRPEQYYDGDRRFALILSIGGPFAMFFALTMDHEFHGFLFRRPRESVRNSLT